MDVVIDNASGDILGQVVTPADADPRKVYFLNGRTGYGSRPAWMVTVEYRV